MDKNTAKQQIAKLIDKYKRLLEAGKVKSYNEAQIPVVLVIIDIISAKKVHNYKCRIAVIGLTPSQMPGIMNM